MTKITTKDVFSYILFPALFPRFRELFSVGFSHTAYFVALLFETVRLLPSNHPYLNKQYFGRYSVSQVIGETWKRLTFSRQHIDQIFIFFTVCLGILIFFLQVMVLVFTLFFNVALAGGGPPPTPLQDPPTLDEEFKSGFTISSIIETKYPGNDIAFMLLDRVFGVDDMFNSRFDPTGIGAGNFPYPYHHGLHTLFQTFSVAMLAVALLIVTYFVTTIVAETVRDGTPFGKRMNRVWAPIRLVLAFGLLVPMASGLNAAQYIVLVAAKWGSGFATNGLTYYYGEINNAGETPFGPEDSLIATPNPQDPASLLQFMLTARACQYATQFYYYFDDYKNKVTYPVQGYYIFLSGSSPDSNPMPGFGQTDHQGVLSFSDADVKTLQAIMKKVQYESVIIVIGHKDKNLYADRVGAIEPFCGRITMPLISGGKNQMALDMQGYFLATVAGMWKDEEIIDAAAAIAASKLPTGHPCDKTEYPVSKCSPLPALVDMEEFKARKTEEFKDHFRNMIKQAIADNLSKTLEWCGPKDDPYLLSYGWGGAAICFNKIASYNGIVTASAIAVPLPDKWPLFLEYVLQRRMQAGQSINTVERFNPVLPVKDGAKDIFDGKEFERVVALASYEAYRQWAASGQGTGAGGTPNLSGMGMKDIINLIFGTEGIFNMTKPENRDIHPLAQLSSAGRGLIESAIRNVGFAGAGMGLAVFSDIGVAGAIGSGFMFTFATISMAAGFVLFYVVPLMPFMYFFFAVAGWIKGIFEAMVGVPLWALAHLRIDGDGIPGNAAMTGYMLILEIFLRPILILFGLLASSLIFVAMARILNEMWSLVVENLTGFDQKAAEKGGYKISDIRFWRTPIDEFFYTVIYAIVIYMIALACFKLVDLIPNYILRWLGHSVEAFGETLGDPTAQLSQKATVGFSATSSKIIGAAETLGGGVSSSNQGFKAAEAEYKKSLNK
ncbi:MAG: DotA/TraY family protein [Rhodospirillales bacterium]|nr:DotA/TraY family protein [Rhodospirillales bacterium]